MNLPIQLLLINKCLLHLIYIYIAQPKSLYIIESLATLLYKKIACVTSFFIDKYKAFLKKKFIEEVFFSYAILICILRVVDKCHSSYLHVTFL